MHAATHALKKMWYHADNNVIVAWFQAMHTQVYKSYCGHCLTVTGDVRVFGVHVCFYLMQSCLSAPSVLLANSISN